MFYYGSLQCGTSHLVHCVACFGVILNCFQLLFDFYDIGSDDKVTLWERAARSGYNMFSVPCQVLTRATFIIVDCMLR